MTLRTKILAPLILFLAGYPFLYFYVWSHYVAMNQQSLAAWIYVIVNILLFPAQIFLMASMGGERFGPSIELVAAINVLIGYALFLMFWWIYESCFKR